MSPDQARCEECHQNIESVTFRGGSSWTVDQLVQIGRKKFKRALCMPCYRQANKGFKAQQGRAGSKRRGARELMATLSDHLSSLEVIEQEAGELRVAAMLLDIRQRLNECRTALREAERQPVPSEPRSALSSVKGLNNAESGSDSSTPPE